MAVSINVLFTQLDAEFWGLAAFDASSIIAVRQDMYRYEDYEQYNDRSQRKKQPFLFHHAASSNPAQ
jgi:hypothetical protein